MPAVINVPDRREARTKQVEIEVTSGKEGEEKKATFAAELPMSLADAVGMLGEQDVFKRFINSYVVYLQGKERNKLTRSEKPRARASYLESLGI